MSVVEYSAEDMEKRANAAILFGLPPRQVDSAQVLVLAALALRVSVTDLRGPSRLKSLAYARHVAMYVARAVTGESFPEIGRAFGGRDHTTVMSACWKIAEMERTDRATMFLVDRLKREARG